MADTIPLVYLPMFLHCVIGLVAARVAYHKGYDLGLWLVWGMIGGTISLVDALRRSPQSDSPLS
ncbi:MAG: hypothetical protein AAFW95_00670 [Cyanobacteria bacterium J06638_6]